MERLYDNDVNRKITEIYSRKNGMSIENKVKNRISIYKILFQVVIIVNFAIGVVCVKYKEEIFKPEILAQASVLYEENIENKIIAFFNEEDENNEKELNNISEQVNNEENTNVVEQQ